MYVIIYGWSKGVRPRVRLILTKGLTFLIIDVLGTSAKIDYLLVILRCVQLCDLSKREKRPFFRVSILQKVSDQRFWWSA